MPPLKLSCSFVLLTFNQAKTVVEAVKGALAQTGDAIEIVITDDCSTDSTFDLIQQTVEGYTGPHEIVLNRNERNLGLAGNIARAHDISTGDVIIAAAGDDISLPNRSTRIMQTFSSEDALLVCSYAKVIGPDGESVPGDFRTAAFYQKADLDRAARSKALYIGATGAWHRMLYDKYGPLDPEAYEDLVFGFRAALEGKVSVIAEELVFYRLGGGLASAYGFHASKDAFKAFRQKNFIASSAIMRQRTRDAKTFGLPDTSKVWQILRKESVKSALGLSFYKDSTGRFLIRALKNPLLALHTWHSESRRMRKSVSNAAKAQGL